jgi:hypothetical protein
MMPHMGVPWDKDHEGRIYVYVDPSEMSPETRGGKARDTSAGQSRDELLEAYRDQVEFLRRELEPEQEPRESHVSSSEEENKTPPSKQHEPSEKRSWLHRFFFGE